MNHKKKTINDSEQWKCFKHDFLPNLKLQQVNTENFRYYQGADGIKYPSVTSVLGMKEKPELEAWMKAVGPDQVEKSKKIATHRGSQLHLMCEYYLKNILQDNMDSFNSFDIDGFKRIQPYLNKIDNIMLLESFLYSNKLRVAGAVDNFAYYDTIPSVIDFKTSKHEKHENEISSYFSQASVYAAMIYERYHIQAKQIVILFDNEFDSPKVFIKQLSNLLPYYEDFKECRTKFYKKYGI